MPTSTKHHSFNMTPQLCFVLAVRLVFSCTVLLLMKNLKIWTKNLDLTPQCYERNNITSKSLCSFLGIPEYIADQVEFFKWVPFYISGGFFFILLAQLIHFSINDMFDYIERKYQSVTYRFQKVRNLILIVLSLTACFQLVYVLQAYMTSELFRSQGVVGYLVNETINNQDVILLCGEFSLESELVCRIDFFGLFMTVIVGVAGITIMFIVVFLGLYLQKTLKTVDDRAY